MADPASNEAKLKERSRSKWLWIALSLCIPIVAISCVAGGFLLIVNYIVFPPRRDATLADYAIIRTYMDESMAHFPASIPPEATGIRFVADGFFESFPAPDKVVELRYVLPPSSVGALSDSVKQRALRSTTGDGIGYGLRTPDDQDSSTPLPLGFTCYNFNSELTGPERVIAINPTTGEVIFYVFR